MEQAPRPSNQHGRTDGDPLPCQVCRVLIQPLASEQFAVTVDPTTATAVTLKEIVSRRIARPGTDVDASSWGPKALRLVYADSCLSGPARTLSGPSAAIPPL